jgi:2-methylisocitrate lyase-like PEP mutase family enzyme
MTDEKTLEAICKERAVLIIMLIKSHLGSDETLLKEIQEELVSLSLYSFRAALAKCRPIEEQVARKIEIKNVTDILESAEIINRYSPTWTGLKIDD